QPHRARKIHDFQDANVVRKHGVRQALGLNDWRARPRTLSLRHFHSNLPSILPAGVGNAQAVCPPHIEGWHRGWKVLSVVHGDQHVAGLDTGSVCRTTFKNVQEKPALSASAEETAKSRVNRMLGKNLFPALVIEGCMAAPK